MSEPCLILLAGKREVPREHQDLLVAWGRALAREFPQAQFRSGNAPGADTWLSQGVWETAPGRLELFRPRGDHFPHRFPGVPEPSLDDLGPEDLDWLVSQAQELPGCRSLMEAYVRQPFSVPEVAYYLRNVWMVLGLPGVDAPASLGCFYLDLEDPGAGGTGFTWSLCCQRGILVRDQRSFFPA